MKKIFKSKSSKKSVSSSNLAATSNAENEGYDVKEKDLPKLHKAAWLGDVNKVKQLAKKAADYNQLDKENRTPLHLACSQGHKDVVEFLMSNKAKLNLCDNHNRSPLMKAVQADCEAVVIILLKNKADPNLVDKESNTALHLASKAGSVSIAARLLDSGALPNASNKDGNSPLHLATDEKHNEVVELLLNRNADVNAVDNQNRTGLMLACLTDQIGMVRLFLDHKASTDIKDHKGWTANDHAIMGGYHGCSHLIDEHQASNRPRSRGTGRPSTGMFGSGTVDSDSFGYALGGPAFDYGDDEEDEISADKVSNGEDSWAVSASEAEDLPKPVKKAAVPSLTKFMPESDTESVKSLGVGAKNASQSRIPRAVSRGESLKSATSFNSDRQTSRIPRPASASPDHAPISSKKSEKATKASKQHVPKSGFGYGPPSDQITPMSTPRGSMTSLADSEWDDDDVLAALEGIPPQKVMRTPIAEEEEDDTVTPKLASKPKGGKLTKSDKKMRKDVLNKLGMSDVDDEGEESEQFSETAPSIEPKGSTIKKKPKPIAKTTKNDTPRSITDDAFDDDWDSAGDYDMLPSHASDNKVHAPSSVRPKDGGGKAQGTPDKMNGNHDEEDWDTDDEEEEESEWEMEKRRQEGKRSTANRKDTDEDDELLRQEQWDKEMKEREGRMKREAEEEIQREQEEQERQKKERFRKEEEKKAAQKKQDEERKRLEQQRIEDELKEKEELERMRREEKKLEKQRQEEQRIEKERQKEERRKDEEKREKRRKEEARRLQEEKEEYERQQKNIKRERERVLEEEELAKKRIQDLEKAAEIKRKEEVEKQKQLEREAEEKRKEEERKLMMIKSEFERKQMEEHKKLERMKKEEEERLEAVRNAEEEKRLLEERKLEEMKRELERDHQLKEEERKEQLRKLEIERQKLEEERLRQEKDWKKQEEQRKAQAKKLEEEAIKREHERKIEEEEKIKAEKKRQEEERQQLEKEKKILEIEKEEIERRREDEARRMREEFERQQEEQKRQLEEEKLRFEEERLAMERRLQEERVNLRKEVASGKMTEEKYIEEERLRVEEEKRKFEEQRMEIERKRIEKMEKEDELRRAADDLRRNEEEKIKAEKMLLEEERRNIEREKLELENMRKNTEASRTGERNLLQYQRSLEERLAYEDEGNAVNTGTSNRNITNNAAQQDGRDEDDEFDELLSQLEDEAEIMLKRRAHPSSTSALEQRPKMKHSKNADTQSAGNLGGGHLSEGAMPYKPANSTFSMDPYSSMIIHPTVNSFQPAWKAVLDEHDGLSFSSSEGGDSMEDAVDTAIQPPYFSSTPLPQLNMSGNASTSHEGAMRMHAALRDHKRIVEKERTARINAENKSKALQTENKELHRQQAELIRTKNELEQRLVELESKIRDLEFHLGQEVEKRHNSQIILEKTREQLARKEELYSVEIDARQKTELNSRNTMLELKTVKNNIKQLEEECDELRKHLLQERSARALHEEFSHDIAKKHDVMKELKEEEEDDDKAVHKTNFEKVEIISRLELADENRKTALTTNDKLKDELYILKIEYERQKIKYKDSHGMLASENEELSHKIDQLKNDIRVNDEALAHATYTFNAQLAAVKAENVRLHSEIERDRSEKAKLMSELNSLSNRLETTSQELEKSQQARTELERAMQRERDEAQQMRVKREQELITSKDTTQANAVRLGSAETRVISMENEIHVTQSTLMERNNQLMSLQRELDQRTNKLQMQDAQLQREKEEKVRLGARLETANERLNEAQNEVISLKKSSEMRQSEKNLKDRETLDATDKLNMTLNTLRADKDRAQVLLEEKNENLSETISQLRNEIQQRNQTGSLKDQDVKALQQNLMDTTTKLSVAEAHLEHAINTQEAFMREKNLLMKQLAQMEEKLILSGHDHDNLVARIEQLEEKLSQAEKSKFEASEQLSAAKLAVQRKAELDDHLREVETKNARLEVMLKQESARCETLEKNLQEAHKMRSGMEAIVNNLNSTNLHMEGRLCDETAARSVFAMEAEEHKDLWETEVKSRSRLGIKMAQLERSRAGVMEQVEEERRKTRKVAELKRVAEAKLENEIQRNRQQEQEMNTYKMKLKLAKKKLKDLEMPELRINSLKSDFERERINMDATVASLRRQLEDVSQQLEQENKLRSEGEVINRQLQRDASSVKIIGKGKEKLEKSKKRLEDELHVLKGALHQDFIEKGELERYKQELDAKARIEINEKLDQVNSYLDEQAQAREKLEQLRISNEEEMKKELENTITSQKAEIVKLRSSYHDVQTQKDTLQSEAARFKELYERELRSKQKVSMDLENARDRSSNYESKLNFERQRNQHLKEASISPSSPILKRKPQNDTEIDSFTAKVWSELDKSISRHLRSASMEIGPNIEVRENLANGLDRSRLANVRQQNNQYMDTLRRNYFF